MKRQQQMKIAQAVGSQTQTNILMPKRLVSSLHQALWQTSNGQKFAKAILFSVMGVLPLSLSTSVQATELDVYEVGGVKLESQDNSKGPVVTLMLDTSGRMGRGSIGQAFSGVGDFQYKRGETEYPDAGCTPDLPKKGKPTNYGYIETRSVTINGETIEYKMYGCKATADADGVKTGDQLYDQISRLKDAVITLLANTDEDDKNKPFIPNEVSVGLGRYSAEIDPSLPFSTNSSGNMLVPAKPLTAQHRADLIRAMSNIRPIGEGPVPQALAEAGAYMLGTTTAERLTQKTIGYEVGGRVSRVANPNKDWETQYFRCKTVLPVEATNYSDFTSAGLTHIAKCSTTYPTSWGINNYLDLRDRVEGPTAFPYTLGYGPLKDPGGHRSYSYFFAQQGLLPDSAYSGFGLSKVNTKKSDGQTYESPLNVSAILSENQCGIKGSNGIYFLTSGYPTSPVKNQPAGTDFVVATNNAASKGMNKSLSIIPGDNQVDCNTAGLINSYKKQIIFDGRSSTVEEYPTWGCTGSYAKILREKSGIVTAIAGMGPLFEGIPKTGDKYDCSAVSIPDNEGDIPKSENSLQNKVSACKVSARGQGFGEGGFYPVRSSKEIADSIQDFVDRLGKVEDYNPQPGDGLTVAIDPTNSTDSRSFAYLPMLLPRPGESNLVWKGNLKRYNIKNGTLFDKKDNPLFSSVNGQIKADSFGLWNDTATPDGAEILAAGAYAKLTGPDKSNLSSTRTVFVETKAGGDLKQIKVNGVAPQNVDGLGYDLERQLFLLNFLGYNVPVTGSNKPTAPVTDVTSYAPSAAIRVLGGINNSKPQEVLYDYNKTPSKAAGTAASVDETYKVLFGSMDGALHLIDAQTGVEEFAFIPNVMVDDPRQVAAFQDGNDIDLNGNKNDKGKVVFGVDAPWYVRTKYNRSYDTKTGKTTITAKGTNGSFIKVYGGLGRGGKGIYGLDITNSKNPSILFHIEPATDTNNPLSRLGRTWSKPIPAKVNMQIDDGKGGLKDSAKDVLFVTGGYDLCYDIPNFTLNVDPTTITDTGDLKTVTQSDGSIKKVPKSLLDQIKDKGMEDQCLTADKSKTKSVALGNAVYMIDADNGNLLWSTSSDSGMSSSSGTYTSNPNLKHSVVGEVSVIDKNYDGKVDAIYFADFGGQVFRADFDNKVVFSDADWAKRVVRVLDTNQAGKNPSLRFYQRPIVSVHRVDDSNNEVEQGGTIKLLVTVASGDRSNPLAKLEQREAGNNPNKVISLWDADFVKPGWLNMADTDLTVKDVKLSDMIKFNWKSGNLGITDAQKTEIRTGTKKGWYDELTYFSGTSSDKDGAIKSVNDPLSNTDAVGDNVNYLKVISQPTLRASRLFVPVYNRLAYIPIKGQCAPVPTGVTEAQEYCLPFGVCSETTASGSLQPARGHTYVLGSGIGSVTIASGEGTNRSQIITPEQVKTKGTGSDVLQAIKDSFYSLYKLVPNQWFENNSNS